jgi:hypothetical protein
MIVSTTPLIVIEEGGQCAEPVSYGTVSAEQWDSVGLPTQSSERLGSSCALMFEQPPYFQLLALAVQEKPVLAG